MSRNVKVFGSSSYFNQSRQILALAVHFFIFPERAKVILLHLDKQIQVFWKNQLLQSWAEEVGPLPW